MEKSLKINSKPSPKNPQREAGFLQRSSKGIQSKDQTCGPNCFQIFFACEERGCSLLYSFFHSGPPVMLPVESKAIKLLTKS